MPPWQRWPAALGLIVAVLGGAPASAELVEHDIDAPGDQLGMLDTGSNLVWLDLTQSVDLSINDVLDGVGNSLLADGWAWASPTQLCALFEAAGYPDERCPQAATNPMWGFSPGRTPLVDLLGVTVPSGDNLVSYGLFGPREGQGGYGYGFYQFSGALGQSQHFAQVPALLIPSQRLSFRGHFLVRAAPSPGPNALGLAALATLQWLGRRRRRAPVGSPRDASPRPDLAAPAQGSLPR